MADQLLRGDRTGGDPASGPGDQEALESLLDTTGGRLGAHAVTVEPKGPSFLFEIRYVKHDSGG